MYRADVGNDSLAHLGSGYWLLVSKKNVIGRQPIEDLRLRLLYAKKKNEKPDSNASRHGKERLFQNTRPFPVSDMRHGDVNDQVDVSDQRE